MLIWSLISSLISLGPLLVVLWLRDFLIVNSVMSPLSFRSCSSFSSSTSFSLVVFIAVHLTGHNRSVSSLMCSCYFLYVYVRVCVLYIICKLIVQPIPHYNIFTTTVCLFFVTVISDKEYNTFILLCMDSASILVSLLIYPYCISCLFIPY